MFNKKLKQDITEIKKVLNIVDNYFSGCPCCKDEPDKILKHDAKCFQELEICPFPLYSPDDFVFNCYTTEKCYKNHLPFIKKQQKVCERFMGKKL